MSIIPYSWRLAWYRWRIRNAWVHNPRLTVTQKVAALRELRAARRW